MSAKKKKDEESFEEAIRKLKEIVEKMEQGEMSLEEAMEAFTEGVRMVNTCQQRLTEAESRVRVLMKDQESWTLASFGPVSTEESGE